MVHDVAVVALDDVSPFDLGIACETFTHVSTTHGRPPYAVRVCGATTTVRSGHFDIQAPHGLDPLASATTVLVPGVRTISQRFPDVVLEALNEAAARGARIASICTGAFVLAAAGLLDDRRATTHWMATDELARRHPRVEVDRNVLFVDEGCIVTSAGASAGLDMCLHLIGRDHGLAAAADAARLAVAPLHREGTQAQFMRQNPPPRDSSLASVMAWMLENLHRPIDVADIAAQANTSTRTLIRRFHDQVGTTPIQWLLTARVRRAQALLEETSLTIDGIALTAGFQSAITLRKRFVRIVGLSPGAYRRRFAALQGV